MRLASVAGLKFLGSHAHGDVSKAAAALRAAPAREARRDAVRSRHGWRRKRIRGERLGRRRAGRSADGQRRIRILQRRSGRERARAGSERIRARRAAAGRPKATAKAKRAALYRPAKAAGRPHRADRPAVAVVQHRIGAIFALLFLLLVLAGFRTAYLGVFRGGVAARGGEQPAGDERNRDRPARHDHRPQRRRPGDLRAGAATLAADPYLLHDPLRARPGASRRCSASRRTSCCASSRSAPASSTWRARSRRGRPRRCSR